MKSNIVGDYVLKNIYAQILQVPALETPRLTTWISLQYLTQAIISH